MITGLDLVEWQLRVAQGERLPLLQDKITKRGHAFEARIYAEDPDGGFMPGAGPLLHLATPEPSELVRVETGVRQGDEVSVYYDPMIAKLVVWGENRDAAARRFDASLLQYHILGLKTNINFLRAVLNHPEFRAGNVYTDFIPDHKDDLFPKEPEVPSIDKVAQLVAAFVLKESFDVMSVPNFNPNDPFSYVDGFRVNKEHRRELKFNHGKSQLAAAVIYYRDGSYSIEFGGESRHVWCEPERITGHGNTFEFELNIDGSISHVKMVEIGNELTVFDQDGHLTYSLPEPKWLKESGGNLADAGGGLVAPMPGVIEKINVKAGQKVAQNDPLVVMIAMKMEYVIKAPKPGTIDKINCKIGDSVAKNFQLIAMRD